MIKKYLYLGKEYELSARLGQKELIEVNDKIYIALPISKSTDNYIIGWYKERARKIITERTYYFSNKHQLHFRSITVGKTAANTRWGSCSSQKNLNFNWKLIMAPIEVIDYVVIHELSHLANLDHSRSFWESVGKMQIMYREYRLWLKRHGHKLTI